MIRVLIIDLMLLIAGVVPAFAKKVTLACRNDSSQLFYYITVNTDAKTVTIAAPGSPLPTTHPAQITDEVLFCMAHQSILISESGSAPLRSV